MSAIRLMFASLVYHWRTSLAVGLGVAAGTAVLTGALLVGDSMRGSLRDLTVDRLGKIDEVLVTDHFFRAKLADELAGEQAFQEHFAAAVPAIVLQTSIVWEPKDAETDDTLASVSVGGVSLIGCDERFWELWDMEPPAPARPLEQGQIPVVLNQPLADRLKARVGDRLLSLEEGIEKGGGNGDVLEAREVFVRLPRRGTVPAETLLGREPDTFRGRRLTVIAVIPGEGPGRFSLRPSQQLPLVAYVSLAVLQTRLRQPDRVYLQSGELA